MLNISNFISGVEKILFQLISWIILIPKTLFWILASPETAIDYFKDRLDDNNNKGYQHFISPIFLYLFVTIIPVIIRSEYKLPEINIEGNTLVVVDSTYQYTAKVDILTDIVEYRASDYVYQYLWKVSDSGKIHKKMKSKLYLNHLPDQDILKYSWGQLGEKEIKLNVLAYQQARISDEKEDMKFEYNGRFLKDFAYVNVDTIYDKMFSLEVVENKELANIEGLENMSMNAKEDADSLSENDLYKLALLFLLMPLAFTVGIIITEGEELTFDNLKENLYVQAALFSPVLFVIQVSLLFTYFIPSKYLGTSVEVFFLILIAVTVIWFIRVQAKIYLSGVKQIIAILVGIPVVLIIGLYLLNEALFNLAYFKYLGFAVIIIILIPIIMSFFGYEKDFSEDEDFNLEEDD